VAKRADAFRTISEVAQWLDVAPHVLRFWESKFHQIKPVKRAGGRRYYRPNDMRLLGGIKTLLHVDNHSIKEAQAILRESGVAHVAGLSRDLPGDEPIERSLYRRRPEEIAVVATRVPHEAPSTSVEESPAEAEPLLADLTDTVEPQASGGDESEDAADDGFNIFSDPEAEELSDMAEPEQDPADISDLELLDGVYANEAAKSASADDVAEPVAEHVDETVDEAEPELDFAGLQAFADGTDTAEAAGDDSPAPASAIDLSEFDVDLTVPAARQAEAQIASRLRATRLALAQSGAAVSMAPEDHQRLLALRSRAQALYARLEAAE